MSYTIDTLTSEQAFNWAADGAAKASRCAEDAREVCMDLVRSDQPLGEKVQALAAATIASSAAAQAHTYLAYGLYLAGRIS